jgi:hypothetical protein
MQREKASAASPYADRAEVVDDVAEEEVLLCVAVEA